MLSESKQTEIKSKGERESQHKTRQGRWQMTCSAQFTFVAPESKSDHSGIRDVEINNMIQHVNFGSSQWMMGVLVYRAMTRTKPTRVMILWSTCMKSSVTDSLSDV